MQFLGKAHGKPDNYNRRALRGDIKLVTDTFEEQVAEALVNYEGEGCKGKNKPCTHDNQCCNGMLCLNDDDDSPDIDPCKGGPCSCA